MAAPSVLVPKKNGSYRLVIDCRKLNSQPLYNLLNKEKRFHWTEVCDKAFQSLRNTLQNAPILGFPTETDIFVLCTDASLSGIGAVFSQNQGGYLKFIAFASKLYKRVSVIILQQSGNCMQLSIIPIIFERISLVESLM